MNQTENPFINKDHISVNEIVEYIDKRVHQNFSSNLRKMTECLELLVKKVKSLETKIEQFSKQEQDNDND